MKELLTVSVLDVCCESEIAKSLVHGILERVSRKKKRNRSFLAGGHRKFVLRSLPTEESVHLKRTRLIKTKELSELEELGERDSGNFVAFEVFEVEEREVKRTSFPQFASS